ncbi:hypothetical protein C8R47DRAFT_1066254 [Mycena vitilis]|nr:hypothetical protein C8R47DRAFT_1066254 [Mycena vitilis]
MAVADTTHALENGDLNRRKTLENGSFNKAKALFRCAQERCFLGEWVKAEEDYTAATKISDDRTITDEFEELKRLHSSPAEDQAAWISGQEKMTSLDFFKEGEVRRRIKEMLGYNLPVDMRYRA